MATQPVPNISFEKNLYTDGTEFYIADTTELYTGDYHKVIIDGGTVFVTGKVPSGDSMFLSPIPEDVQDYNRSSQIKIGNLISSYYPKPNKEDYKRGWFTRYFARRANDPLDPVVEIDKKQYDNIAEKNNAIAHQLYSIVSLRWRISGRSNDLIVDGKVVEPGVIETNFRTVAQENKKLYGLNLKLANLTEFYHKRSTDDVSK